MPLVTIILEVHPFVVLDPPTPDKLGHLTVISINKSRTAFLSRLGMNSEPHSSSPLKWTKSNDSRASKVHITSKRELL